VDGIEVRLDLLASAPTPGSLASLAVPSIVTLRDASEGGALSVPASARARALGGYLGVASLIDIELRHARRERELIRAARVSGTGVILSYHDFLGTPPPSDLNKAMTRAVDAGADVFKVAAFASRPGDLAALLALLDDPPLPIAVMGMGPLGRISRLLFASCGSFLNYGWLHRPQVEGQWPAQQLKRLIAEVAG